MTNPLEDSVLKWVVSITNRDARQTRFLLDEVLDWNFPLYMELENAIKYFHVGYCPADLAEAYYLIGKLRVWKACGWYEPRGKYVVFEVHGLGKFEWVK